VEERRAEMKKRRAKEIKSHAIAFLMLGLSLFALYTHMLYVAIIPLLWMAFRAGKEHGREQTIRDVEQASILGRTIRFPEREGVDGSP
jgi:hypothetical protein